LVRRSRGSTVSRDSPPSSAPSLMQGASFSSGLCIVFFKSPLCNRGGRLGRFFSTAHDATSRGHPPGRGASWTLQGPSNRFTRKGRSQKGPFKKRARRGPLGPPFKKGRWIFGPVGRTFWAARAHKSGVACARCRFGPTCAEQTGQKHSLPNRHRLDSACLKRPFFYTIWRRTGGSRLLSRRCVRGGRLGARFGSDFRRVDLFAHCRLGNMFQGQSRDARLFGTQ